MPVEWRLHVLEERLKREGHEGFEIVVADLGALTEEERHTVLDAMLETNGTLPITLVNGVAVCASEIDLDAISACVTELAG